jgi:NAD(P)-dependent dehydrogenase (short-subunit alcohol dehydrogenase family)
MGDKIVNHFADKLALVAGGTGALGREICISLLAAGARVITTYRQRAEFDTLTEAWTSDARSAVSGQTPALTGAEVDTTDAQAVAAMVQSIGRGQEGQPGGGPKTPGGGHIDILINAVGGYAGGKNIWEEDPATCERMLGLNLKSGFNLARAVVPGMILENRGWIVNIASRAGYGHSGGAALYSASKAGALALFDSLAEEVKPYAINVNTVVPSIFDTPANRRAMPSADYAAWPKPAEIASVVRFLCSPEAQVIHGAAIPVYGRT